MLKLNEVINRKMDFEQLEIDRRSDLVVRFQRTLRRLVVLSGFAKLVNLDFDIEQLDISNLTRRAAKTKLEWQNNRIPNDVLDYI